MLHLLLSRPSLRGVLPRSGQLAPAVRQLGGLLTQKVLHQGELEVGLGVMITAWLTARLIQTKLSWTAFKNFYTFLLQYQ